MALTIQKVYDCNVYVNNASVHGQASEVTLPDVNYTMNEFASLGMFGTISFFNGIEQMEATVKWTYADNETQKAMANPVQSVDLHIRSSKAVYQGGSLVEEQPIVVNLRGRSTKHQGGSFHGKDDVEVESVLKVDYYKLEIDGEDIMAERRANLGI